MRMAVSTFFFFLIFAIGIVLLNGALIPTGRSFAIDYENNTFVKDGKPFQYVSGSIHYFRVPKELWFDRLSKMKAGGLNAVETYVEWRSHEKEPGIYDFSEGNDLVKFIKIAQSLDLLVILRPGPYICAERDMGGLPYWLLGVDKNMKLRSSDPSYLFYVDRYFDVLLPMLKPLLYENGGPIITVQVENEYGSYDTCDHTYTAHLRDLTKKHLGDSVVLFTTDGPLEYMLKCGKIEGVYASIDFGPGANVTSVFAVQRMFEPKGPLINSEFYPGWLDHWGNPHATVGISYIVKTLDEMLAIGVNVNFYMFHGGTNWGFGNGANLAEHIQADPTSYDYDAPLNEAGDPTEKYYAIREVIAKYFPLPPTPTIVPSPKMKISSVGLKLKMPLLENIPHWSKPVISENPLTFEEIGQAEGFVLYTKQITFKTTVPVQLSIPGIRDRGYVYADTKLQGILSREQDITSLPIKILPNQNLTILVENQGRIGYGSGLTDFKGILGDVKLNGKSLKNWAIYKVNLDNPADLRAISQTRKTSRRQSADSEKSPVPAIYTSIFSLPSGIKTASDTFLKLDGWHKGVAYLNGHNLGRYWPINGPQVTLYVPGSFFHPDSNVLTLLELENAPCNSGESCSVQFVDAPILNGATPNW